MAKETRKQIVEQTRNEVARQYKAEINSLKERLNDANENALKWRMNWLTEKTKAEELQEKVNQYEDWIRRLQEYMDMDPDEREKKFAEMKTQREINEQLNGLLGAYSGLFNLFTF